MKTLDVLTDAKRLKLMHYEPVENLPVARFWYKGSHTHPVRRTVLVTEVDRDYIRGYELRDGKNIRPAISAPIKTFRRSRIARGEQLRSGSNTRRSLGSRSTLYREPLINLVAFGA